MDTKVKRIINGLSSGDSMHDTRQANQDEVPDTAVNGYVAQFTNALGQL